MASKAVITAIENDFKFLKKDLEAVLLYGSSVGGKVRDLDICLVPRKKSEKDIIRQVFRHMDVVSKKYDVYCFDELPLYLK